MKLLVEVRDMGEFRASVLFTNVTGSIHALRIVEAMCDDAELAKNSHSIKYKYIPVSVCGTPVGGVYRNYNYDEEDINILREICTKNPEKGYVILTEEESKSVTRNLHCSIDISTEVVEVTGLFTQRCEYHESEQIELLKQKVRKMIGRNDAGRLLSTIETEHIAGVVRDELQRLLGANKEVKTNVNCVNRILFSGLGSTADALVLMRGIGGDCDFVVGDYIYGMLGK